MAPVVLLNVPTAQSMHMRTARDDVFIQVPGSQGCIVVAHVAAQRCAYTGFAVVLFGVSSVIVLVLVAVTDKFCPYTSSDPVELLPNP